MKIGIQKADLKTVTLIIKKYIEILSFQFY